MSSETRIEVPPAPFAWAKDSEYSQSAAVGDLIFISGQGGFDASGELVSQDFDAQVRQTFDNIAAVLAQHDASWDSVVKLTVHFADPADFDAFKAVRREYLQPPWPVAIGVCSRLLVPGMLIEIDVIASRSGTRQQTAG